jgi:hypothetical protein
VRIGFQDEPESNWPSLGKGVGGKVGDGLGAPSDRESGSGWLGGIGIVARTVGGLNERPDLESDCHLFPFDRDSVSEIPGPAGENLESGNPVEGPCLAEVPVWPSLGRRSELDPLAYIP